MVDSFRTSGTSPTAVSAAHGSATPVFPQLPSMDSNFIFLRRFPVRRKPRLEQSVSLVLDSVRFVWIRVPESDIA